MFQELSRCMPGLLPYGLESLANLLEGPTSERGLLPESSPWGLLLALRLLAELRDPTSRHAPCLAPKLVHGSGYTCICS